MAKDPVPRGDAQAYVRFKGLALVAKANYFRIVKVCVTVPNPDWVAEAKSDSST